MHNLIPPLLPETESHSVVHSIFDVYNLVEHNIIFEQNEDKLDPQCMLDYKRKQGMARPTEQNEIRNFITYIILSLDSIK